MTEIDTAQLISDISIGPTGKPIYSDTEVRDWLEAKRVAAEGASLWSTNRHCNNGGNCNGSTNTQCTNSGSCDGASNSLSCNDASIPP